MGKLLTLFLLLLSLGLPIQAQKNALVLVTIPPYQKIANQIGAPYTQTFCLIPPGASDEANEPSIQLLNTISKAHIFFTLNTLPIELNLKKKLSNLNRKLKIYTIFPQKAQPLDPHLWNSPTMLLAQLPLFLKGFSNYDPANTKIYTKNTEILENKLQILHHTIQKKLTPHKGKSFIIIHPTLGYFAKDYGLNQLSISSEENKPLDSNTLFKLIQNAKARKVKVVIIQPDTPPALAKNIAKILNAKVITFNPMAEDILCELENLAKNLEKNL